LRLKDRIAIVTGAARGIGQAIALRFAREGAHVVACDVNAEGVKKVSDDIAALGRRSLWFPVDVSNVAQVEDMVKKTGENFGRIDILVNDAGGSFNFPNRLEEVTMEMWDKIVDVNLKGTFICSKAVVPYMKRQKSGRIINVSSQAAKEGSDMTPVPYHSAKAGIMGLTRKLARELGPFGITANGISPGICLTPRVEELWMKRFTEEQRQSMLSAIPLRRPSTADEQASVVLFLASDDASYVTGVFIDVNGGWHMS